MLCNELNQNVAVDYQWCLKPVCIQVL